MFAIGFNSTGQYRSGRSLPKKIVLRHHRRRSNIASQSSQNTHNYLKLLRMCFNTLLYLCLRFEHNDYYSDQKYGSISVTLFCKRFQWFISVWERSVAALQFDSRALNLFLSVSTALMTLCLTFALMSQ